MTGLDDLRRRLYAPGASAEDVERFETALAQEPEPDEEPQPEQRRRRRLLLPVAAGAIAATVAVALIALPILRPSKPPPSNRPPAAIALSPVSADGVSTGELDDLFTQRDPVLARLSAQSTESLLADRAAPHAQLQDLRYSGSGGGTGTQRVRLDGPIRSLRAGDLLVLTVIGERAVRPAWRFEGTRAGEEPSAHPVLVATSSTPARTFGAVTRIRQRTTLDSLRLTVPAGVEVRYRYALFRRTLAGVFVDVSAVAVRCDVDARSGEDRCARDD